MAKFNWYTTYSVNHEIIDNHHRHIIDLFNRIYDNLGDVDSKLYDETVDELIAYAGYHFDAEKKLMEEIDYADIECHLKEHQQFSDKVLELKTRKGQLSEAQYNELVCHLGFWVLNHETEKDMPLAKALNQNR